MKLLFSSPDHGQVAHLVKRLLWARIPCAVCKDTEHSCASVWVQQDIDYPGALRILIHRAAPYRLPHWASVFDHRPPPRPRAALPPMNRTATVSSRINGAARLTSWNITNCVPSEDVQAPRPPLTPIRVGTFGPPTVFVCPTPYLPDASAPNGE